MIAEGAAWIAHDGLRLTLAKPLEVLVAAGSGRGTYLPLAPAGFRLPVENQTVSVESRRFYCVDPRDGAALFEFAKPKKVGLVQPGDERVPLSVVSLPVDPTARALQERLECELQLDHDYIAHVTLRSLVREDEATAEIHDLDFALALPTAGDASAKRESQSRGSRAGTTSHLSSATGAHRDDARLSAVSLRSNVASGKDEQGRETDFADLIKMIPGDLVERWWPELMDTRMRGITETQREEAVYYSRCAFCKRTSYQINSNGPIDLCRRHRCPNGVGVRETRSVRGGEYRAPPGS